MGTFAVDITLTKMTYKMDDGNLISGVQISIAPMVYKFISLNNQKLALLAEIRPNFYQWFMNSHDGATMILREVPVVPHSSSDASDFVASE